MSETKTAVVTGAGSGIGRAIAQRLGADGWHVAVLELNEELGTETAELIKSAGGTAETLACNVADLDSVQSALGGLDRIDALVNNAGIASIGNVENTTVEEFDKIYAVNVKGVFHCLSVAIPLMVEAGGGVVLNMASVASKLGIADRFAYSMSKGAVYTMTLSVAKDYVDKGIRCNCLCPARVHTPFVDGYLEKTYAEGAERDEMFKTLSDWQPIGRMAKPDEIGALAAFLCSDDAAFITGAAYDIDGGVTQLR